jgi:hypothetical protein
MQTKLGNVKAMGTRVAMGASWAGFIDTQQHFYSITALHLTSAVSVEDPAAVACFTKVPFSKVPLFGSHTRGFISCGAGPA